MFKYLIQLTQTDRGQSSGRFGFLLSVVISNIVVWFTWLVMCILKGELINIPEGVVYAYAAAQGLAFGGKGLQAIADRPATLVAKDDRKVGKKGKNRYEEEDKS